MDNQSNTIDFEMIREHWIATSNDDFKTMNNLFLSGSNNWALFVGHISVEKLLKALYVQRHKQHAPRIHNLYRLAELCEVELSGDHPDWLDTVTSFNINARYDDYKKEFQKICTKEYTALWIGRIKELRQWIERML